MKRRNFLEGGAALAASMLGLPARAQQQWPTRHITIVSGYPPGGGSDIMARFLGEKLAKRLGQSVVVENKPGTAGQIGAAYVARSAPDGYTMLIDAASFAINLGLYPNLPYDYKSFEPIGVIAQIPLVMVVNPNFPAHSVADVIAVAKAKPGEVFYASSGNGSLMHIAASLFAERTHTQLTHVPYKGGAPAMNDVVGGQVPLYFSNAAATVPFIKAGRVRPLAVTSGHRSPALPDVPTLAEAGVPDVVLSEWNAFYAPAGVPPEVVARISDALIDTLRSPDVKEWIRNLTGEPFEGSHADSVKFIDDEVARMARLIKERDIRIQ